MPAADVKQRPLLPRITSQSLAMRPETRRIFLLAGLGAVLTATAIGAGVAWMGDRMSGASAGASTLAAFWGGLGAFVASILGVAAIPVARRVLIARADVQLIEAASPLHPLIRRLMTEAPGTYAHALATASLAEAGAEAVGADALIARVGAYYHDIGKIKRPCYFFENIIAGENPHDDAKPSLSALIITAHVTDGLELADEYGLPPRVRDIIREHHGTSLIRYFYQKAADADIEVAERDFRYHGGRPSTREAALVMLADACEASVRALVAPGQADVQRAVHAVIAEKIDDHQLDLSGLGESDVDLLSETFSRVLVGMLHARCEYPRIIAPGRDPHADQRSQPSRA
jgi:hypothetical protein